jgi:ubiquinone/menaquinone biosynthesis C-methylase UbiE
MQGTRIETIFACPICKEHLPLTEAHSRITCESCGIFFVKETLVWNFIPKDIGLSSPKWKAWETLQKNGEVSYQADPDHNLSVGERTDCKQFAAFCNYQGLVLDVGCGPQPWPSYFDASRGAAYIGVDPLAADSATNYLKVKALAEYLPFCKNTFDHILFSTSLDHFVDSIAALREAKRVCKSTGEINVWLGEKRPGAPRPLHSPDWYLRLWKPALAEDLFHIKRLHISDFLKDVETAELTIAQTETHNVDEYRSNYFFRIKI